MLKKIKLLRISEAAEMLGVNPETLRRCDNNGQLKAIKLGTRSDRRYKREDLEKLIEKRNKRK